MSQSVDQPAHKSLPKSVTKTTNKRKRSPTILKSTQQSIPRKKPKTSNVTASRARSQQPHHIKPHSNGATPIKAKSNGSSSTKPHSLLRPTNHSATSNKQQIQSKIDSIDKQKKQLMDPNNSIASTFKGMWKSRQPPQHLLQATNTNTNSAKATKTINDTNRGLKRRASGPPTQPPAAKRQKIAPKKSQSQDPLNRNKPTKNLKKSTRDEPPPLVTLNEVKWENTQKISDYRLGIKPTIHCLKKEGLHLNPYRTNVLYETALSHIANDELHHGIYHQDLDSMIHQHKALKHKLKRLRDDLGSHIPRQPEPIQQESPWDCLLDEVAHVANNIKTNKLQQRLRCKLLSTAVRDKFEKDGLHKELYDKYQERTRQIAHQMEDRFEIKTKNTGNKVFRRSPNIEIAKAVKTFWNHTFQQWNALKQDKIASQCVALPPLSFVNGFINLNLDGNNLVDPSVLESIKTDYDLKNVNTTGKVSDIKRAVLLHCRATLLQPAAESKPIKIRGGKFKCKLRDYQFAGLNWLISLYQNKSNGILAEEVGSGKTAQIIALFAWLHSDNKIAGPHLIIVPGSKIANWQNQFKAHYPQCKVLVFQKGITVHYDAKAKSNAWNVCIVSYDLVVRHSIQFRNVPWKYMVMDEAERVQDFSSPKWCSLFQLRCQSRLLLVDDAALNAMQLWSMLFCLAPNAFASKQEFVAWIDSTLLANDNNGRSGDCLDKLQHVLGPFILKRSRSDMKSLPEIIEKQYICNLTPRQQQLYDNYTKQHGQNTWKAVYELQQICNHPNLYQPCSETKQLFEFDPISQIDYVRRAASDLCHNVKVVFSQSDKSETKRIEQLYEPLFVKMRDAVSKINKEEKANKMDQSDDSEDADDDDSCCVTMANCKVPSKALRNAMSMALESILQQKKNEMDQDSVKDDELLPLHIDLFSKCLSQFCAQGLSQWNCSKLNALAELLEQLHSARRHRVVLFASSERMLDILELFVLVYQYQYVRCGFAESKASSLSLINKFENDRDAFIFIMSTRNIHCCQWNHTKADTVIFYEHEWDSVVQDNVNKFMKTVHGGHSLTVYRLINQHTIEHQVFQHFKSNLSQLSVARYYSHRRNISMHGFNSVTAHIEAAVHRVSLRTFYDEYDRYNKEFSNDIGPESEQYIAFVKEQLLLKEPNNKLLPKLFDMVGFKTFVRGNVIHHQYNMIKNKLKYLHQCYSRGANQLNKALASSYYASYRNRSRPNMKCAHLHSQKSFIDFNDSSKQNKDDDDVQILEKKSKVKSDKMEMSEDDDDDDDIKCIDPSPPTKKKNKKTDSYTVSNEIRDTIYVCDENGEYYHHLYEPYVPYGAVMNNCKMDEHLSSAIHHSLNETHDPNNYQMYLDYNYNQHDKENDNPDVEDEKDEEKALPLTENNDKESVIQTMKIMFEQWKDKNNEMYRTHGIVPGYLDKDNQIQICPIDPKTKDIIYGSLDDFVRNVGSAHVWRLYQREKLHQPKEKSVSIDSDSNHIAPANDGTYSTSPAAPIKSSATKPAVAKPKRFKLKLNNTQKSLSNEFEDKLRLNDDYYFADNNALSRLEDEARVIRSPDYEIPLKVYDHDRRMTAFDFEIFKIKQEYKCGASNKNLKQIIDDFKFTPKPQVIHYQDSTSPSPMHDGDAYRLSDAEETTDSEASDKDSVHASSTSSSPMPSHDKIILESSPSSSVNITTLSPNTQRKTDLLNSLRVPHSRKNNANNYNINSQSDKIRDIKSNMDEDHVTLSAIHRWIGVRNDGKLPPQKTPLKPFKVEPKKDPKTGATRYDPKYHPTIFSSKEIGNLHHIVNSFAAKTKGRRRISWRMVKQTLKTKQNINMRCRTRFELLRVYSKTARQCKRKDFESLSYFGMNETQNLHSKKQKKSKRTAFWDARFSELQEKKGRGNKKQFKEPLDFDDKKLNAITKKMTKRMVKELDVCISRVVDLTPDNQNKDEHASHQQTIKAAYQKLNLIVQGQKPYAPNYIWKNHWGQLPVNPYTKPNISHPQQAPIHPSMNPSAHQSMAHVPHHGLVRPPMPPHAASSTQHPSSYMATHAANPNIPPGHRPSYHPGYYSMRAPHHVPSHHVPSLHASHIPPPSGAHPPPIPGPHNTHSLPQYTHHAPSAAHPLRPNRLSYSMPPYPPYQPSYPPHPNAAGASRPPGPAAGSAAYPTRVQHSYHPPYPYMSSAAMNPSLARPGVHATGPPTAARPRYGTPMGAATAAPQQHPSYTASNRNTPNTNNAPPARPNTNNSNTNSRQSAPNAAVQRPPTNPTTPNANASANPNSARMSSANSFRRPPPYASASRVGASLAGSGAAASYTAQQRQHMLRQQQQRQYAAQLSANSNAAKSNPNTPNQAPSSSTLNSANPNVPNAAYRNRNGPSSAASNPNNTGSAPRNLSQPPRLEQHTTTNNRRPPPANNANNMNPNSAKNQYMNSPRPSLSGTMNHDNSSNRNASSSAASSKALAPLHGSPLFKNRQKQFMNGNKKQPPKQHGNTQQNPFGSPSNTNKNTSNALGLPSITDNNTNNANNHPTDRDVNSNNEADREARNGFVSMPNMGSVPTINQSMNTTALPPRNLLIDGQMQREYNNPNYYANHPNTAVQSNSNQPSAQCPTSAISAPPPSHSNPSASSPSMLTRNFHRHRTNHNKAQKHTVVTNGNGRSVIKPSHLPRGSNNNPPQTSSPSVVSNNGTITSNHMGAATPTVISTASSADNNNNTNSNNRSYYNHPSQPQHQMMNGHAVRQRNQQFVNNNNQYAQQRPPQPQQSYRGMQPQYRANSGAYPPNSVNNINRGMPR